jgi:hypothetical protein
VEKGSQRILLPGSTLSSDFDSLRLTCKADFVQPLFFRPSIK